MNRRPTTSARKRALTAHELELWSLVTKLVIPLRNPPSPAILPAAEPLQTKVVVPATASFKEQPAARKATPLEPGKPPLVGLERRVRQRLSRGLTNVDDAIDLHGLRQEEAHVALRRFLFRAHASGARLVLVVTGKGRRTEELHAEERGVLRRNVPHWLRASDLRPIVLAFEEASHRHGGAGALYIRLRAFRS
jgi:DNA-nicking Smr family endonuclease